MFQLLSEIFQIDTTHHSTSQVYHSSIWQIANYSSLSLLQPLQSYLPNPISGMRNAFAFICLSHPAHVLILCSQIRKNYPMKTKHTVFQASSHLGGQEKSSGYVPQRIVYIGKWMGLVLVSCGLCPNEPLKYRGPERLQTMHSAIGNHGFLQDQPQRGLYRTTKDAENADKVYESMGLLFRLGKMSRGIRIGIKMANREGRIGGKWHMEGS